MTNMRVVMQARTTSTRLPAKALLPIAGMPSSVLAAKRASRASTTADALDFVFATSDDPTDDLLAATATAAGLTVFRGSKDDVLGRYAAATADMAEDDIVIRITGDDPVPDADFLRTLVESRAKRGVEMLFSLSPADGLPHGVAAQAFSVGALRQADREATLAFEREHVGPWMVRHLTSGVFDDHAALDLGHLRCTLDTLDDYFALQSLFDGVADPIGVPWRALVDKLAAQSPWHGMPFRYLRGRPGAHATVERLGAVVPEIDSTATPDAIRHAIRCGATHFIATPGESAKALGAGLANGWSGRASVILHLAPPAGLAGSRIADWIEVTLLGACRDLGIARLHTVVIPDLPGTRGAALLEHLVPAQGRGLLGHIGFATATPAATLKWTKYPEVTYVELGYDDQTVAPSLAGILTARPELMIATRAPLMTALNQQPWAQAVIVPLSTGAAWSALIAAARTLRPQILEHR